MQYGFQVVSDDGRIGPVFSMPDEQEAHNSASNIMAARPGVRKVYVTRHFAGFWHQWHVYESGLDYPFGQRPVTQTHCPLCGKEKG